MGFSTRRQVVKTALGGSLAVPFLAVAGTALASPPAAAPSGGYTPQTRDLVASVVPLVVHEMESVFPSLKQTFGEQGLLAGKEIYGLSPSALFAFAGDTIKLTIYNPADDAHVMTLPELGQNLDVAAQADTTLTLPTLAPGIYRIACVTPEHFPFMWGTIMVLPAPA